MEIREPFYNPLPTRILHWLHSWVCSRKRGSAHVFTTRTRRSLPVDCRRRCSRCSVGVADLQENAWMSASLRKRYRACRLPANTRLFNNKRATDPKEDECGLKQCDKHSQRAIWKNAVYISTYLYWLFEDVKLRAYCKYSGNYNWISWWHTLRNPHPCFKPSSVF